MPVSFTAAPENVPAPADPKVTVRRLLAANAGRSSGVVPVLAVLTGLLPTGVPAATIRRLLVSSVPDESAPVRRVVDNVKSWSTSVQRASAFLKDTPDASNPVAVANKRVQVATSLLSLLLSVPAARVGFVAATEKDVAAGRAGKVGDPVAQRKSLSPRVEVNARVLTAMIGAQLLTDPNGWDSAIAATPFLATKLNLSERSTWRLVKQAIDAGFLRPAAKTSKGVNRYRLGVRGPGREAEIADAYLDTITALALGDTTDPLADLLLSVANPTWAYAGQWDGIRGWYASFLALAAAPTDPTLGLPAATRTRLRKKVAAEFVKAGQPGIGRSLLEPQLGVLSDTTLAAYVYADVLEAAKTRRDAEVAKRDAFIERRRQERVLEKRLDDAVFTPLRNAHGGLPEASWGRERTVEWWQGFQPWWVENIYPVLTDQEIAATLRRQLQWRLRQRGHKQADWFITQLFPATVDQAA